MTRDKKRQRGVGIPPDYNVYNICVFVFMDDFLCFCVDLSSVFFYFIVFVRRAPTVVPVHIPIIHYMKKKYGNDLLSTRIEYNNT